VEGAKLLDLQTRHHNLDFFVAFSSASASIGARNACLYAASNSSLNALMVNRRRLNLAASSIQWGLWDNSAAIGQRDLIAKSGFLPMKPALAIDALERLLGSDAPATIVASIDWQTLQPALEMQGRSAFVQDINADPRAPAHGDLLVHRETIPNEPHSLVLAIKDAPERDRIEHLMVFVGEEAKAVFGMPSDEPIDEERGLFQMGMNSLMSVELKKRLESKLALKLPGTLTLTYPTVTALAKFLDRKLFPEQNLDSTALRDVAHANHDRAKVTDDELSSLAEMDDAETDAAIAAELEAIHQKLGAH
jgi:myxalamid-type polyketide synthase MxaE and MxaD